MKNIFRSKNIGIDARFYGPQTKGLGRYIERLIEHIEKTDLKDDYIIFLRKENWDNYNPKNKRIKKVLADFGWYSLAEQIYMPYLIWKISSHLQMDSMKISSIKHHLILFPKQTKYF